MAASRFDISVDKFTQPRWENFAFLDVQVFYPFRFVLSLTANKIVLGWSVVGRRRFDGLAVVGGDGGGRGRNRLGGRSSLLRISFRGNASLRPNLAEGKEGKCSKTCSD